MFGYRAGVAAPVLGVFLIAACGGSPESEASEPEAGEPEAPVEEPAAVLLNGGLRVVPQDGWVIEEPKSTMRAAQYSLPGEGDVAAASLVVYYFGPGAGGSVEDNRTRWKGQFEAPGGGEVQDAQESEREVNGLAVHDLAVSGTFVAETSPGSGEYVNEPGWRMRAAVVERSGGNYYLKLTGPEETVKRWEASYDAFVGSLRD